MSAGESQFPLASVAALSLFTTIMVPRTQMVGVQSATPVAQAPIRMTGAGFAEGTPEPMARTADTIAATPDSDWGAMTEGPMDPTIPLRHPPSITPGIYEQSRVLVRARLRLAWLDANQKLST